MGKRAFPIFHGTDTEISLILFTLFVAIGLLTHPTPPGQDSPYVRFFRETLEGLHSYHVIALSLSLTSNHCSL
jgi:hypothetical protein